MDLDELKRRTIANEWDDLLARYRTGAGNEIDPDRIRDLFKPEYDGTNVVAYHPYSSLLAKRLYAEALAALSGVPGRVLFVVGMPGAGKSRALRMGSDVRKEAFDIVYDGAFGSAEGLYREIDQALAAGVHPTVVYIHNTPARAFDNTRARVAKTGREVS